jgi:hypothetical protein
MLLVFLLATLNTLATANVQKRKRKLGLVVSSSYAVRLFKLCSWSPQVFLVSSSYAPGLLFLCMLSLQVMRYISPDYVSSLLFLCRQSLLLMQVSPLVMHIWAYLKRSVSSSCAGRLLLLCRGVSSSCAEMLNKLVKVKELDDADPY